MSTIERTPTRLAPGQPPAPAPQERIAGAFVIVVMFAASVFFWVGIPIGGLYLLGKVVDSSSIHFILGLIGVPLAMVLFAPVLFWLNALYLRVTGVLARMEADEEEFGWSRRTGGPLEPMLFVSFVVAAVALFVWFFAFAHNPPSTLL
ncbi:hypothetical protein BH10ACT11_BH10ACT11_15120 [soil metagenome]